MINELVNIVGLSIRVSGTALFFSALFGVPAGAFVGLNQFPGRRLAVLLIYTGMAFPPVVIGLVVYLLLSRSGPLGSANIPLVPDLFTPGAMILAQTVIAFPVIAGFSMAAVMGIDPGLKMQLMALGATKRQIALTILSEARFGVIVAIIAGFGSIISEVGAVMLVGGNIKDQTRVLTTAIVLETRQGDFALAMTLGGVLLLIALFANIIMMRLQGRGFDG